MSRYAQEIEHVDLKHIDCEGIENALKKTVDNTYMPSSGGWDGVDIDDNPIQNAYLQAKREDCELVHPFEGVVPGGAVEKSTTSYDVASSVLSDIKGIIPQDSLTWMGLGAIGYVLYKGVNLIRGRR